MSQLNDDEGISTIESVEPVNQFFEEETIPLRATQRRASSITNLATFIEQEIDHNHDLWVEYHAHEIHADDQFNGAYLHDGLIEGIDVASGLCTVIDPVPEHRQRFSISLDVLARSISDKHGRETGFLIVQQP